MCLCGYVNKTCLTILLSFLPLRLPEDIGADTGITDENKALLEKVRMNARQEYLQGQTSSTSSVRASDRLMRELRDIYRSQNFKDGQ